MNYIFEYLNKELHNSSITSTLIDTLTIDGKLEIKYPFRKNILFENCQKDKNNLLNAKSYSNNLIEWRITFLKL